MKLHIRKSQFPLVEEGTQTFSAQKPTISKLSGQTFYHNYRRSSNSKITDTTSRSIFNNNSLSRNVSKYYDDTKSRLISSFLNETNNFSHHVQISSIDMIVTKKRKYPTFKDKIPFLNKKNLPRAASLNEISPPKYKITYIQRANNLKIPVIKLNCFHQKKEKEESNYFAGNMKKFKIKGKTFTNPKIRNVVLQGIKKRTNF